MRRLRAGALLGAWLGLAGCGELAEPMLDNPLEDSVLPVPKALRASVSDATVQLTWEMTNETGVTGYRVFRRAAGETRYETLADVSQRAHDDGPIQNGRSFEYAVAARGQGGTIGRRSTTVLATPNLFSIILGDGRLSTASTQVTAGLSFPAGTAYMILSNSSDFSGASWEAARASRAWFLTPDDGTKTVYAKFRDSEGSESDPVSDTIDLDTVAEIRSVLFTAPAPVGVGSVVHLRTDVGEVNGIAFVRFGTSLEGIELRDDGTLGDPFAADGVFERDLVVGVQMTVLGEPATGSYTDGAGNEAPEFTGPDTLTIAFYPQTVALASVQPGGRARLTVQWTESSDPNFTEYRVYRSPDAVVDVLDPYVHTENDRGTLVFTETGLREGQTFFYRIFVRAANGLESGGNVVSGTVTDLAPPQPVLYAPTNIGQTTMTLRWDPSTITDFLRFRLYRSSSPGVSDITGTLIYEGTLQDVTYYNDFGLTSSTTYYYVLYVDDIGLKTNQSLEIVASTL